MPVPPRKTFHAVTATFIVSDEHIADDRARRKLEQNIQSRLSDEFNIHEDGVFLYRVTGLRPHKED